MSSMRSAQALASSARVMCSPTPVTLHATPGLRAPKAAALKRHLYVSPQPAHLALQAFDSQTLDRHMSSDSADFRPVLCFSDVLQP